MRNSVVAYHNWVFEVDREFTIETYLKIIESGADSCLCNNCKNYVAYRDRVFPDEILRLFDQLGINYKKEVEVVDWQILQNGFHQVGGWFHFKGRVITGKSYRVPIEGGGYTYDLTPVSDNFSIGFAEGDDLTFFEDSTSLVQVEFMTTIPWVIAKSLEDT